MIIDKTKGDWINGKINTNYLEDAVYQFYLNNFYNNVGNSIYNIIPLSQSHILYHCNIGYYHVFYLEAQKAIRKEKLEKINEKSNS